MSTALDALYDKKRRELISNAEKAVKQLWLGRIYGQNDSFTGRAIQVVEGGQRAIALLVAAFMTQKVRMHTGRADFPMFTLPHGDFTVEKMRGVPAADVYARPFATLGHHISEGATFADADNIAAEYAAKLASTDLQLAQTYAARHWIEAYNAA